MINMELKSITSPNREFLEYPTTKKTLITEKIHTSMITDEFRWLEKPESEDVKKWITTQNAFTKNILTNVVDTSKIHQQFTELYRFVLLKRNAQAK